MIIFIKEYFQHSDHRGSIKGLVNFGCWEEVNIIESEPNVVRGNHYHKDTDELFIILDGKIKITLQNILDEKLGGKGKEYVVKKGDVFLIQKNIHHMFEILEYSRWLNVLSVKTDDDNPDIIRVSN